MSEPIALDPNCVSLKLNDWRFLDMRGHILLALGDTNVALEDLSLRCGSNAGGASPSWKGEALFGTVTC